MLPARRLGFKLLFGFHHGSYDTATPIGVLTGLHGFLGGAPVNLIWDNLTAHKSAAIRESVADQDRNWPGWRPTTCRPTHRS